MRISNQSTTGSIDKLPQASMLNSQPASFGNVLSSTAHSGSEKTTSNGGSPVIKKRAEANAANESAGPKSPAISTGAPIAPPVVPTLPIVGQALQESESDGSTFASSDRSQAGSSGTQVASFSETSGEPVAKGETTGVPAVSDPLIEQPGEIESDVTKMFIAGTGFTPANSQTPEVTGSVDRGSGQDRESQAASQLAGGSTEVAAPSPLTIPELNVETASVGNVISGDSGEAIAGPEQGVVPKLDGAKTASSSKDRSSTAEARSKRRPGGGEGDSDSSPKAVNHSAEKTLVEAAHNTRTDNGAQPSTLDSSLQASAHSPDTAGQDLKAADVQQPSAEAAVGSVAHTAC